LPETLDPESLRKYFTLTETDLQELAVCRGVVNKIGFAVQLCTLRRQGYLETGKNRGLDWIASASVSMEGCQRLGGT
jgi:hypothetical protein